jgi:hypothetical protein
MSLKSPRDLEYRLGIKRETLESLVKNFGDRSRAMRRDLPAALPFDATSK